MKIFFFFLIINFWNYEFLKLIKILFIFKNFLKILFFNNFLHQKFNFKYSFVKNKLNKKLIIYKKKNQAEKKKFKN